MTLSCIHPPPITFQYFPHPSSNYSETWFETFFKKKKSDPAFHLEGKICTTLGPDWMTTVTWGNTWSYCHIYSSAPFCQHSREHYVLPPTAMPLLSFALDMVIANSRTVTFQHTAGIEVRKVPGSASWSSKSFLKEPNVMGCCWVGLVSWLSPAGLGTLQKQWFIFQGPACGQQLWGRVWIPVATPPTKAHWLIQVAQHFPAFCSQDIRAHLQVRKTTFPASPSMPAGQRLTGVILLAVFP